MSDALRVERDGAAGEVTVREGSAQAHEALAGARAWLALGRRRLEAGEAGPAYAAALSGIEELGDSYWTPDVIDDTSLKLAAAEDRPEPDAAEVALRVLEIRAGIYLQAHPEVL
jgi:hypothetical protein